MASSPSEIARERAEFHVKEGKRKEAMLDQLLKDPNFSLGGDGSIDTNAIAAFYNRYSNRLYLGPFLRGLLQFSEAQSGRSNVIFWAIEQDLLTQSEDEYLKDAIALLRKSLCIHCELVPPFKSIDQLNDDKKKAAVIYHLSFHTSLDDEQLNKLCKTLRKTVGKLKSVTKASGTLILNDLSRLRNNHQEK